MPRKFTQKAVLVAGSFLAVASSSLVAEGKNLPGTGASVAISKKVAPDDDSQINPFVCPFLLEMARSLARNGLPSGFFLRTEDKPFGAGLDLRALLLYEAGILQMPVRLFVPAKKGEEGQLKLSLPAGNAGGVYAKDKNTSQSPTLSVSGAASTAPQDAQKSSSPLSTLSFDLGGLNVGLLSGQSKLLPQRESGDAGDSDSEKKEREQKAESYMFKLWTANVKSINPVAEYSRTPGKLSSTDGAAYQGTFFLATPRFIDSIEGRTFFVKKGSALASVKGKNLAVITPLARIMLAPGSACVIDSATQDLLRVFVLECDGATSGVTVRFNADGKGEQIRLSPGELFVRVFGKVSLSDKSILPATAEIKESDHKNWTRAKFSVRHFAASEALLRTDLPGMTPEERSAVSDLKARLK